MMGPTHSASAAAAGLGFAVVANNQGWIDFDPATALIFAGVTAGAGLLPDLDHPQATIARTWGPFSRVLAKITNAVSAAVVNMTGSTKDAHCDNGHRKLTHTALFCIALAPMLVAFLVALGGTIAQGAILFFFISIAMQALFKKKTRAAGPLVSNIVAGIVTFALMSWAPESVSPSVLALATAVGCLTHVAGDAVTKSGVPFFAPFVPVDGGKRWGNSHLLPQGMTVSASGAANTALFWVSVLAFAYLVYQVVLAGAI